MGGVEGVLEMIDGVVEVDELDSFGRRAGEERPVVLHSIGELDHVRSGRLAGTASTSAATIVFSVALFDSGIRPMRTLRSRCPSPSTSDTGAHPASRYPPLIGHHPVERDHHCAGRVRHLGGGLAHRRLERLTLRLQSRRQRLGQSVQAALRRLHVTEGGQHLLGFSRRQMRHQHRALASQRAASDSARGTRAPHRLQCFVPRTSPVGLPNLRMFIFSTRRHSPRSRTATASDDLQTVPRESNRFMLRVRDQASHAHGWDLRMDHLEPNLPADVHSMVPHTAQGLGYTASRPPSSHADGLHDVNGDRTPIPPGSEGMSPNKERAQRGFSQLELAKDLDNVRRAFRSTATAPVEVPWNTPRYDGVQADV